MRVSTAALEIRLGVRTRQELPRVAADALAAGVYSEALVELAGVVGLPDDERAAPIAALAEQALADLRADEFTPDQAAAVLVRRYASMIECDEVAPIDGAAQVVRLIEEMRWHGHGRPLWDAGSGDIYLLADEVFGGARRARAERLRQIEASITRAAERLLASLPAEP